MEFTGVELKPRDGAAFSIDFAPQRLGRDADVFAKRPTAQREGKVAPYLVARLEVQIAGRAISRLRCEHDPRRGGRFNAAHAQRHEHGLQLGLGHFHGLNQVLIFAHRDIVFSLTCIAQSVAAVLLDFRTPFLEKGICDILDEIRPRAGSGPRRELITFVKDRPGHDWRYAIDSSKLQSELGWAPRESFRTGLRKTIVWYLENAGWVTRVRSGEYLRWIDEHYGKAGK